jgi:ABC-type branched-subunit amino acid transport system substrate-binding protein
VTSDNDSIKPPETAAGRRRRRIRTGLLVLFAVLAVSTLAVGSVVVIRNLLTSCGDGLERRGRLDECIGLTDGSFVFREEYRQVQSLILAENEFVRQQNMLYVTVAWLEPMTLTNPDSTDADSVRHSLQGAYLAQYRANHPPQGQRPNLPLVRLLLANPGSQAEQWEPVVDQIRDRREAEHIVAVAGLGQSLDGTRKAINRLAQYKIPMVAGLITADSMSDPLGQREVPGFIRVVPTNTDQVSALVQDVKDEVRTAMLVQDTSPNEVYTRDIGNAFQTIFPQDSRRLLPVEEFDSSLGRTVNDFPKMVLEICQEKPDIVFFSGRAVPLLEFLNALADRKCIDQPIRVLTGDSASNLAADQHVKNAVATGVTLQFTNLAEPAAWNSSNPVFFSAESTKYFREAGGRGYFSSEFPNDSAEDGLAITSHDAMWTAVLAARGVVALTKDETRPPTTDAVAAQFDRMHGTSAVPGASGWISLDENGNPRDKALTIVRVGPPSATPVYEVSSASGTPCDPDRLPC